MKPFLLLLVFLQAPPALTPPAAPVEAWTVDTALAKLQARVDSVTDLSADFRQEAVKTDSGLTLQRRGKLYLKKPGLMRFDYAEPDRMFYVSDGSVLVQYLPADRLAYKLAVQGSSLAGPFRFLVGAGRVTDEFDVKEFRDQGERAELVVTPKQKGAAYTKLTLGLRKAPFELDRLEIVENTGNVNRLELSALSTAPVPRAAFDVAIPADVRVHDLSNPEAGAR
jgi:outer membrane lipoprotein carrier protein